MPDAQSNAQHKQQIRAADVHDCRQEAEMNATNNKSAKLTVLYQRLSKDDPKEAGESGSIKNQRDMLVKYAEQNGYTPYVCLSDDGLSGTNYDRPGWSELMELVEADKVGAIILKSLDRMGRNYLESGMLRELFAEKDVRLIAINDGVDTFDHPDDFIPFREIMAEYFARDISRKTKSVLKNKGRDGKPLTANPPYGFLKDPNNPDTWIVDEFAANVVRRIYYLTIDGKGPHAIARILHDDNVERPSYYLTQKGLGNRQTNCAFDIPYAWQGSTVAALLARPEYAGHLVNFRTTRPSFKSKKFKRNDPSEWQVFENALPAIVPQETWDLAQKCRETTRRVDTIGEANPLTGLLYCADCGAKMYNHRSNNRSVYANPITGKSYRRNPEDEYHCSAHNQARQKYQQACSRHHISTAAVREIILEVLRRTAGYVRDYETEFVAAVREESALRQGETVKSQKKAIAKNERRIDELEKLITGLLETLIKQLISEERFKQMTAAYEKEQSDLKALNARLNAELAAYKADEENADNFVELVRRYTNFEVLTNSMINEFVERIDVHEGEWSEADAATGYKGTRSQQVDVYLKYIGNFDAPDTRTAEELEAERVAEEKLMRKREYNRRYMRGKAAEKRAAAEVAETTDADIVAAIT